MNAPPSNCKEFVLQKKSRQSSARPDFFVMLSKSLLCLALLLDRTSVARAVSLLNGKTLLTGKDYEVREVTYADDGGTERTSTLYYIQSPEGLLAASKSKEFKLPASAIPELIEDFAKEGKNKDQLLKKCIHKTQRAISRRGKAPNKFKQSCVKLFQGDKKEGKTFQDDDDMALIIDNDALAVSNEDDAKKLCLEKGFECKFNDQEDGLYESVTAMGCRSWHYRSKTWSKNLNQDIDVEKKFTSDSNSNVFVQVAIQADMNIAGSAKLDYKYKKKWCVPYKFAVQKVTLEASFRVSDGDITITGEVAQTFDGIVWDIASPQIASGVFLIWFIPVVYSFELPIRAGTGDLELKATGEVDLDQKLKIDGHYKYICSQTSCSKALSSFNDDGAIESPSVNYEATASVKIEPFIDVALKANIYWGLIWAKVGLRPSFPISLTGYFGNTCGDGDGLNGNEVVWAAYLELKFRAGVFFITKWMSKEIYWEFYSAELLVQDLLNPSTAFSPEIRPTINQSKKEVTLKTSLRDCVDHVMTAYQDFIVDWDDGSMPQNILDLTGTKMLTHKYSNVGTYTIKVKHSNDAYTKRDITITSSFLIPTSLPSSMPTSVPSVPMGSWYAIGNIIGEEIKSPTFGSIVAMSSDGLKIAVAETRYGYWENSKDKTKTHKGVIRVLYYHEKSWKLFGNEIVIEHLTHTDYCIINSGTWDNDVKIASMSFSSHQNILLVANTIDQPLYWDNDMFCWDRTDIKPIQQVRVMKFNGYGKDWIPMGDFISKTNMDQFGIFTASISGYGDRVAIQWDTEKAHVVVLEFSDDTKAWNQVDNSLVSASRCPVVISEDGKVVAMCADYDRTHVQIFWHHNNVWGQLGSTIDISNQQHDATSSSISLSSDGLTIAIGIYYSRSNGIGGYAKVFRYNGEGWIQAGNVIGQTWHDESGCHSVSLSSDGLVLAMGNTYESRMIPPLFLEFIPSPTTARVLIFQYDENDGWIQAGTDINGLVPAGNVYFTGYSVALSSDGLQVVLGGESGLSDESGNEIGGRVRVMRKKKNTTSSPSTTPTKYCFDWNDFGNVTPKTETQQVGAKKPISFSADGSIAAMVVDCSIMCDQSCLSVYQYDNDFSLYKKWNQMGDMVLGRCSDKHLVSLSSNGLTVAIGGYGTYFFDEEKKAHVKVLKYDKNKWVQVGDTIVEDSSTDILSMILSPNGLVVAITVSTDQQDVYVHIYQNNEETWKRMGDGIDVDMKINCVSLSLSSDGYIIAIGTHNNNGEHVRVFQHKENSWQQIGGQMGINDGEDTCWSIALSSDGLTISIGPYSTDTYEFWGNTPGYVLIFKFNDAKWDQVGDKILGPTKSSVTYTQSLYLSADALVVGFWELIGYTIYFVVMRNYEGTWVQVGKSIEAGSSQTLCCTSHNYAVLSSDGSAIVVGSFWKTYDEKVVNTALSMFKWGHCYP